MAFSHCHILQCFNVHIRFAGTALMGTINKSMAASGSTLVLWALWVWTDAKTASTIPVSSEDSQSSPVHSSLSTLNWLYTDQVDLELTEIALRVPQVLALEASCTISPSSHSPAVTRFAFSRKP